MGVPFTTTYKGSYITGDHIWPWSFEVGDSKYPVPFGIINSFRAPNLPQRQFGLRTADCEQDWSNPIKTDCRDHRRGMWALPAKMICLGRRQSLTCCLRRSRSLKISRSLLWVANLWAKPSVSIEEYRKAPPASITDELLPPKSPIRRHRRAGSDQDWNYSHNIPISANIRIMTDPTVTINIIRSPIKIW